MGKKSVNPNKSVFQIKREELGYSREDAAGKTLISADRLEKLENGKAILNSDDAYNMAKGYDAPELCNYFCAHECQIGREYVPEVTFKELGQITLETVVTLNALQEKKDRMLAISVDGKVNPWEVEDFVKIQMELEKISLLVDTLQLWSRKMLTEGKIDKKAYEACLAKYKK